MHHLSVNINNRKKHGLSLATNENFYATPFIIQREKQQNVVLFSISIYTHLLASEGFSKDTFLDFSTLNINQSPNELVFSLKTSKNEAKKVNTENLPQTEGIQLISKNGEIVCSLDPKNTTENIKIVFEVEIENNSNIKGGFLLHLAPKSQIFDVVMDFGSEASQVVAYRRGSDHNILVRLNLVDILTKNYYPALKDHPLHQFVPEDLELYHSAFFIKKSDSVFNMHNPPGKNGEKEFLNLLTNRNEIDRLSITHFLVSNLKLAHLGAYHFTVNFESEKTNLFKAKQKDFIDTIGELQQAVINYILQAVLQHLRDSNQEQKPIYLAVRLLVPNVFGQSKVSKMVKRTLKGLDKIAETNPLFLLAGKEVNTISESDASFLGFKQLKDNEVSKGSQPFFKIGKRYLIIDCGKGTTDFSIVELSKNDYRLSSLYRSGFIGAGNVISFAFIDTIFAVIFGEDMTQRQNALYNICLSPSAGLADKIRFIELIEKLKQNFEHTTNHSQYNQISQLFPKELTDIRNEYKQNPTATGLLEQISKLVEHVIAAQGSIQDEFQIIHDAVTKMVSRIAKEVYQTGYYTDQWIDKIILTGRGFLFEKLVEAVKDEFKKPIVSTGDLKKVCLLGAFTGEKINFDSNLVGRPNVYQILSKATGAEKIEEKIREVDLGEGMPKLELPIFNTLKDYAKKLEFIKNHVKIFNQKFGSKLSGEDAFAENTILLNQVETGFQYSPEEQFFLDGTYFDNFNKDVKTISVCGIDYKNHQISSPRVNICYTGNEFLIRDADSSCVLDLHPKFFESDTYVFQTLFPFLEIQDIKKIGLKKLK